MDDFVTRGFLVYISALLVLQNVALFVAWCVDSIRIDRLRDRISELEKGQR